ncbi:MAG TPA: tetratricopeptide repeat-containing glycosyltransferase family protein [Rhizomicrobium sp.]|nr:tetratricopeptide repeat-containing glycosyltransferase family protein [Rhizomicrobium sp.]
MRPNQSEQAVALFAKAVQHHSAGRLTDALASYEAAIRLDPKLAAAHGNRGVVLKSFGRPEEALASFGRALKLQPGDANTWYNQGTTLALLNRLDDAVRSYDRAIRLKPDHAEAYANRGNVLTALGRPADAVHSYDKAVALKPDFALAWHNRGTALEQLDRIAEALASFDRAIALQPDFADAHLHRGNAQQKLDRFDEAIRSYERAIALRPDFAEAYNNKGAALRILGRLEDSLRDSDRAIALRPDFADARNNRGLVLHELERREAALESLARAIELSPDFAGAHWNKSICLLSLGRMEEGWREYEWRKRKPDPKGSLTFPQPAWSGREDIVGKTLFVHAEQGLGDTIQFSRYVPLAQAKGAEVIFAVQDSLMRLLKTLSPSVRILGGTGAIPEFDYHITLLSMPLAFGTKRDTCPAEIPYLHAEPDRVEMWRSRLGREGFRIGICWQGNPKSVVERGRSFPLHCFADIAAIPGVRLISLQKYDGCEQLAELPAGMKVETLGEEFDCAPHAFVDSAAVMECLDLVITSDTAIAHLAGALGRPAWVGLKRVPDWRWLLDRSDTPWYPTLTLFRQMRRCHWADVFAAMRARLLEQMTPASTLRP